MPAVFGTPAPALRGEVVAVAIVLQRVVMAGHLDHDVTPLAAAAAVRTAAGDVLLPAKSQRTGPAVARLDEDLGPIGEHEKRLRGCFRGSPDWAG
jgi:hypothetical protein